MSLTAVQIQAAFKILGKHLELITIANATATQYQGHIMATVRQGVTGVSTEYNDFTNSIAPLQAQINGFIIATENIPAAAQAAIDAYIQQSLAVDMGLVAGTPSATALATLITQMAAATPAQTVLTAGLFYTYIFNTYSLTLATSGSPTISDSWVTSTVV